MNMSDNEERIEVVGEIHDDPSNLLPLDINQSNALTQLERVKNKIIDKFEHH